MFRNNSITSNQQNFSLIPESNQKQQDQDEIDAKRKSKTFRLVIIIFLILTAIIMVLVAVFGTIYGTTLAQTVALKKNFSDSCLTYKCNDALQLICVNQLCSCSATMYWNGYSCASFP